MNTNQTTASPLMTTAEAAAYLSISYQTLRTYRMRGQAPSAVKINGSLRYHVDDLNDYINAHRQSEAARLARAGAKR